MRLRVEGKPEKFPVMVEKNGRGSVFGENERWILD
jgi:hypothetical protein